MFDPITSIHALNQIADHAVSFAIAINLVAWAIAIIGTATKAWQQAQRDRRSLRLKKHQAQKATKAVKLRLQSVADLKLQSVADLKRWGLL